MQRFGKPVENEGDGAENVPRILSMSSVQGSDELERGQFNERRTDADVGLVPVIVQINIDAFFARINSS